MKEEMATQLCLKWLAQRPAASPEMAKQLLAQAKKVAEAICEELEASWDSGGKPFETDGE